MTTTIDGRDELDAIRAHARLLELALLGAGSSGISLNEPTYRDALTPGG